MISYPTPRSAAQPAVPPAGAAVAEADRVACLQKPDWTEVHPLVWHARLAVGAFVWISEPAGRTYPRVETASPAPVPRALAGERFAFPADLTTPALTAPAQPLTAAERAELQRRALELSQMADPEGWQAALATAPA